MAGAYPAKPHPHLGQSDHLSLFLNPKYSPLINRARPSVKTIKASCGLHADIDNLTSSVLDHITTTIDSNATTKQITTYPNQKPWMNKEVRLLLRVRNTAFRSGDARAYSTARANLRRDKKGKHTYKRKIEGHFSNSDPRHMWQGIQAIIDYKPNNSTPTAMDTTFLNELNNFYARFEKDSNSSLRTPLPADHQPLTLSSNAVYIALSQINPERLLVLTASLDMCSEHV
ncbi:hypothetical protein D4764_19G0000790 [Takifugu flavidus]|uniref:Uncharacterized protein n=1 Tax=Takifugu flavidus TaxID=433684 RepID=A0A5C6NNR9_9TELE|nr:hypothetical protein D4764_19G0000790 [Takifugu flavidus]